MCNATPSNGGGVVKRARPSAGGGTGIRQETAPSSPKACLLISSSNAASTSSSTCSAVPKRHAARRRRLAAGDPSALPGPRRVAALVSSALLFAAVLAVIEYELVTHLFGSPAQSARSYSGRQEVDDGGDDDRIIIRPRSGSGGRLRGGRSIDDDAAVGVDEGGVSLLASSANTYEPIIGRASRMPRPLVVAGPSGVGKGTLIGRLLDHYTAPEEEEYEENANNNKGGAYFGFSVSHTTRGARPGEVDGVHYHFATRADVEAGIDSGDFLEHNEVHGNLYGTSFDAVHSVARSGRIAVLDIDMQGVKRVKKTSGALGLDPYYVFVAPPSMELLEQRLRDRGTETEEAIQVRTANAREEVAYGKAPGTFDYVLVNDDLDEAFGRLLGQLRQVYPHLPASVR
jgi:guanylate kinase